MKTRMDQYLKEYGYDATTPTRRVAVSPRTPGTPKRWRRWLPRIVLAWWRR